MQIFNLINSRKIGEGEINVFKNFFITDEKTGKTVVGNKWFFVIFVTTIII